MMQLRSNVKVLSSMVKFSIHFWSKRCAVIHFKL